MVIQIIRFESIENVGTPKKNTVVPLLVLNQILVI